ncbi:Polyketide synthase-nonribosomal peptide synthetase [Arthroderma uncinatum]|uniref:Polyketide synthase-nonribosomal peptide synthetase n=1 Tax=Arthroderma uncinatum TaxID=74035 RepID=UPI00144A9899|nr:Polyketide synthase-nonribosomal peptide synthetase [Arthroderma uncinatum]KAF3491688.1 Polyketide synthase-nonribosomal peptide synthetase [Arthroderma uncinatum]
MVEGRNYPMEPIAIIGSACRFPGASSSPSKLWDLLRRPRDVSKEFDQDRLNLQRFYHPNGDTHGSTDVTNKSYLLDDDTRLFDASFFGISPMEAAGMDPQQRLLLEIVYEASERAGTTLDQLKGSLTSVHVGVMTNDYSSIQVRDPETIPKYAATGTANSIISNRISYVFDLKGPSATIDTACSSSLVALHHAVQGLIHGDSNLAIVAGVNLIFDPIPYISESKLHMLSPDSQSRMWDKSANGYARGEGAAALFLKPLSRAIEDGDHVEAIVRGTGVNSDGQSPGITMPFSPAQVNLIQRTYERAGLDLANDRPQYFECHGTGTPAGDPVEARAISESFVRRPNGASVDDPIYVGSIKTIVGHLEGCAGLAGVIKVILALKHRTIPPNLLFNELNPDIAPYYGPLQVPSTALPWPVLPAGTSPRASVNSFGFGGTNAHVIIEGVNSNAAVDAAVDHVQSSTGIVLGNTDTLLFHESILSPLLFSARSGQSLLRNIEAHLQHLRENPHLHLQSLSWVLQTRRTTHRVRAHFSGVSREDIMHKMSSFVAKYAKSPDDEIGYQPQPINPCEGAGVLGVFTGQGAQWPLMGRELFCKSPLFRKSIEECELILQSLPDNDIPEWSLVEELFADNSSSRLNEASVSQPLCTAVQIALVDLLEAAGVIFHAVVGHSSGEIAAAYACGIITLRGAMQIAYYRGFYAKLASGINGEHGSMLAAELSPAMATQLCSHSKFHNRIRVAAYNAPNSVTLSGDTDAIHLAKQELDKDNIFTRLLRVDTAYHSHHMRPCAESYLRSLTACDIEVRRPDADKPTWNSSVYGNTDIITGDLNTLKGPYWVANIVNPVLFSQALESAIWHGGPFDLAIEVGPHPALKGPTENTFKAVYGDGPLYVGLLNRNTNDIEAFSSALGNTWARLGPQYLNFVGYRAAFLESNTSTPAIIKDLPSYSWAHDKIYWRESRTSKRYRTLKYSYHELLGRRTPDDNDRELRWRNVLKLGEIPWLRGHEILGEVLLPGAAYVSIAVEAGNDLAMVNGYSAQLIDVEDVDIHRPVVIPDNQDGIETLFTLRLTDSSSAKGVLGAQFSFYIYPDPSLESSMVHCCSGSLSVHFNLPSEPKEPLPPKGPVPASLVDIDCEQLYSMFEGIGLQYSGSFRNILDSRRCLNYATATGVWPEQLLGTHYTIHPAVLDVAFQALFIAQAHPASGQIVSALLPSHIDRVRVNLSAQLVKSDNKSQIEVGFEAWALKNTATAVAGDISVYYISSGKTALQIEGLNTYMVGEQDTSLDRPIFSKTVWSNDVSLALINPLHDSAEDSELLSLVEALERVALFYMRKLTDEIDSRERASLQWHHQRMFEAYERHLMFVRNGQHPILRSSWLADPPSILHKLSSIYPNSVELQILHTVGANIVAVIRNEMQILEVMDKDDMLNRFYMADLGCTRINKFLAQMVHQISFKFPRSNILEIGAGTGGTTWDILNMIESDFALYTYTDISAGFFSRATKKFSKFARKMVFKTFDVEKEPKIQGFGEHSYDIIIAANVFHATRNLNATLQNVRSLLRPGGYVLIFETTGTHTLRVPFTFGGFPGWWLAEEPGRKLSPIVTTLEWDELLLQNGFSGAENVVHDVMDESKHTLSLIVSRAIDDSFLTIRDPLSQTAELTIPTQPVLLVGGTSLKTSRIIGEFQKLLPKPWKPLIRMVKCLDDLQSENLSPETEVVCLHELDQPLFTTPMTSQRMATLQALLMNSSNVLWVTNTELTHTPRTKMFYGIARVLPTEIPHVNLQVLGLGPGATAAVMARHCTEAFLRLREAARLCQSVDGVTILWSQEPEIVVNADGQTSIPRVKPDASMNEVYFASRRTITKAVDAVEVIVQATPHLSKMTLQAASSHDNFQNFLVGAQGAVSCALLEVMYALHIPSSHGDGSYLVCGTQREDTDNSLKSSTLMAVSSVNCSHLDIESNQLLRVENYDCTPRTLAAMVKRMFIQAATIVAIALITKPGPVLLYAEDVSFGTSVAAELVSQGVNTYLVTSMPHAAPDGWLNVHPYASKRTVLRAVPSDTQLYIDCLQCPPLVKSDHSQAASTLVQECLPPDCEKRLLGVQLLQEAVDLQGMGFLPLLEDSYMHVKERFCQEQLHGDCEVIHATKLSGVETSTLSHRAFVTDWQTRGPLPLTVAPLNMNGIFRPDRTYLMVGAAGGLGLSICQWMIRNGAKHLVITSRNPRVDSSILDDALHVGASIKVLPMDISKMSSVQSVVKLVHDTMPPIAGVCNAAVVLSDKLFLDMSVEQLNGTLVSKVDGTENLDSVFADSHLDFFILLSSTASIVGNIGQSNYHAANLFMAGLVAQRRSRGHSASIIHIGYVSDVGYVTRNQNRQLDQHFHNMRLMPISETDVHHAFAVAIIGGNPTSAFGTHDIIMGIEPATKSIAPGTQTPWLEQAPIVGDLQQQVEDKLSEDQAVSAVVDAFCTKLDDTLQLAAGDAKQNVHRAIIDLGIDSLIAVDIRTWFLKQLGADIPVVKILGGDTVIQICTLAIKKVMANNLKRKESALSKGNPNPAIYNSTDLERNINSSSPLLTNLPRTTKSSDEFCVNNHLEEYDPQSSETVSQSTSASEAEVLYAHVNLSEINGGLESSSYSATTDTEETEIEAEIIHHERMSPEQARIWFSSKYLEDPTAYNMVFHYRIDGPLNVGRLRHAFQITAKHHESLRTCFYSRTEDGHPMQGLMALSACRLKEFAHADKTTLQQELARLKSRVWKLEKGDTLEATVLTHSADKHDMVFGYHHIIMDVGGWHIFVRDLDTAYRMQPLDKNAAGSYIEYSTLQLQFTQEQKQEKQEADALNEKLSYWQTEFATFPEALPLFPMATVCTRPADQKRHESHHEYRNLSKSQYIAVKEASQRLGISVFHFHLAVLQVLITRYTAVNDICIGIVDGNRNNPRFAQTVGCFINMLPVRFQVVAASSFADIARATSRKVLGAYAHSSIPFEVILNDLNPPRSSGITPLFQVAANYRRGGFWDIPLGEDCRMQLSTDDGKDAETPYDISFGVSENPTGSMVEMHCQASLYNPTACSIIIDAYLSLLDRFSADESVQADAFTVHNNSEVIRALELGRGPEMQFGWPTSLSNRIADMCSLHSTEPAIEEGAVTISYTVLASRITALAAMMLQAGCTAGVQILVLCEPSADAIVSLLAVLHVGAVYVPLDTSLPASRHDAIIRSCMPVFLLSHAATKDRARDLCCGTKTALHEIYVDAIPEKYSNHAEVPCSARPETPSILLFTSGSTGTPKGILLSQANFVNHLAAKSHLLNLGRERVLQQSSLGFDMSIVQIFSALAHGGTLVIAPSDIRRDPVELTALLNRRHITLTIGTPSEYLSWLRYGGESLRSCEVWRHACIGGEFISSQLKYELHRLGLAGLTVTNAYGPTEITAAAAFQTIRMDIKDQNDEKSNFAVGRALPNYSICILDAYGHQQPVNHTGEICIGGAGIALGYLNSDLAGGCQKFIFKTSAVGVSQRLYRTGDRGRLMPDGSLLCFGRLDGDTQVKLRGVRIELEEVEYALLQESAGLLSTAVVSRRGDILVAYAVLSTSNNTTNNEQLTEILKRVKLPQCFVPAAIIILSRIPITANGKIDRKAISNLPFPETNDSEGSQHLGRLTIREGELRLLWERVLPKFQSGGASDIRPSSDFFLCGGNSLLLMKLQAAIKEYIGVTVSTRMLYQSSSLQMMARHINEQRQEKDEETINWAAETDIPTWLQERVRELPPITEHRAIPGVTLSIEVLLTGVTSVLGRCLLHSLVQSPFVSKIHCIATLTDELPSLAYHDSKVKWYTGSLLSPTLGLNTAECRWLEENIDVIIHAGANGHCLNSYPSLRSPNLFSTHFLASIALPHAIPLLFVSSYRVALLAGSTSPGPISAASYMPATDGSEGYTASKWASEVFLENLATFLQRERATEEAADCTKLWRVAVHRPCVLVSEEAEASDALNAILRYSVLMRCVPRLETVEGYIDFRKADEIAAEIMYAALELAGVGTQHRRDREDSFDAIQFRHHSSGTKVLADEFRGYMEEVHRCTFEEVDIATWMSRAIKAGIDPLIIAYLEGILESGSIMKFPYLGE